MPNEEYMNGWNTWAKHVLLSLEELKKQYSDQEGKIDNNRQEFIQAVTGLELAITKEISELKSEIKVMKTKYTQRASLIAAIVALLPTIGAVLFTLLK